MSRDKQMPGAYGSTRHPNVKKFSERTCLREERQKVTVSDAHPQAQHDFEEVHVKIYTFEYSRQTGRRAGRQIDR